MDRILYQYRLDPTTWVYLSSLLTVVVFFKFRRLLSVRNLDLICLIALAPGLLMVAEGKHLREAGAAASLASPESPAPQSPTSPVEDWGYVWLMAVGGVFMVRLLADPILVRRPLLEPNLTADALACLGLVLLVFLATNVMTTEIPGGKRPGATAAGAVATGAAPSGTELQTAPGGSETPVAPAGAGAAAPRFWLLDMLPRIPSRAFSHFNRQRPLSGYELTARLLAIAAQLAIILGMLFIGYRHFDNIWTGIAVATLYLLVPYTAQMVGDVVHSVPGALLVWAVALYRRPLLSGILLGTAIGMIPPYPGFLLPLWVSFYAQRGLLRFLGGLGVSIAGFTLISLLFSQNFGVWLGQLQQMFLLPADVEGFWSTHPAYYRIPVVAVFLAVSFGMAIWPAQKNLGTLFSCSAAVMLGTQFWFPQGGLLHMNWYLPLLLLTIFRPNLEHRVAISTLNEGWRLRRPEATSRAA